MKSEFEKVTAIPQNMEKYLSLSVGQLKFIDSFQFTPQGLDNLANTLGDDEFRYLSESITSNHFGLIRRKDVYPYDYIDSFDRFEETELPSQDAFLANCLIVHAQIQSTRTRLECGMSLDVRRWQIITISIYSWMCFF